MTYLIVGLDQDTQARWHGNISADDVGSATRIARARAAAGHPARRRRRERAQLEPGLNRPRRL